MDTATPSLVDTLGLLQPLEARGRKVRIGPLQDGGVVVLGDLVIKGLFAANFQKLRTDIEYERDLLSRGVSVALFNAGPRPFLSDQPNSSFTHDALNDTPEFINNKLLEWRLDGQSNILLRFDVEGDEYDCIDSLSDEAMAICSQLVIEFHGFHMLGNATFRSRVFGTISKLLERFSIVHVHGNNYATTVLVESMPVHDVIEVTLVEKSYAGPGASRDLFPTVLDFPNMVSGPATKLWYFPFLSGHAQLEGYRKSEAYANRWLTPLPTKRVSPVSLASPASPPVTGAVAGGSAVGGVRPFRIIYFSMHEILEYDDLKMFSSRGHKLLSLGTFHQPSDAKGLFRTAEAGFFDDEAMRLFKDCGCNLGSKTLTAEFASHFDVAIINNEQDWVLKNAEALKDTLTIFRSVGQSSLADESSLAKFPPQVKIVRYSSVEGQFRGSHPSDAVIYFSKDLSSVPKWVGGGGIRCFHNSYSSRANVTTPTMSMFNELRQDFEIELYGFNNGLLEETMGVAGPSLQERIYSTTDVYLYAYTVPPSYTLSFVEAMAAGVPILAPTGDLVMQSVWEAARRRDFTPSRYEIEELLGHDTRLLYSSLNEAKSKIKFLMDHIEVRQEISNTLSARAAQLFDQEKNVLRWERFFDDHLGRT